MPKDSCHPRLVECEPMFDSVSVRLETQLGVSKVIRDDLLAVPAVVFLLQGEG